MSIRPAHTMGDVNIAEISGNGAYTGAAAGAMSPEREQKQLNSKLAIWTWEGKPGHDEVDRKRLAITGFNFRHVLCEY